MNSSSLTIQRAALGRVATVGDFYDARRDQFVHGNLFNQALPQDCIQLHKEKAIPSTVDFQLITSTKEKLELMKLKGEISLSVLCDMVTASGSCEYLNEKRNNTKTLQCVYSQKIRTEVERVNLNHKDIRPLVVENSISSETTHIVVGIIRGCNTFVNLTCAVNEETSKDSIKGKLEGEVEKFGKLGKAKIAAGGENTDEYKNLITDVKLKVFTDVTPSCGLTPKTIEDGLRTIEAISSIMGESANGRGVPITYELLSIKEVARVLGKTFQLGGIFNDLDVRRVEEVKNLLCETEEQLIRIQDLAKETDKNENFISKEHFEEISDMRKKCEIHYSVLLKEVSKLLVVAREDSNQTDKIVKLISEFQDSLLSRKSMDCFFEARMDLLTVYHFLDQMRKRNVTLVKSEHEYQDIKRTQTANILFFAMEDISALENKWNKTTEIFLDLCEKEDASTMCAIVSTDRLSALAEREKIEGGIRIVQIKTRDYVTKDLVSNKIMVENVGVPRGLLNYLMPNAEWNCLECSEELHPDDLSSLYLNCSCGRRPTSNFQYVANSQNNGQNFSYSTTTKLYIHVWQLQSTEKKIPSSYESSVFGSIASAFAKSFSKKKDCYFFRFTDDDDSLTQVENFFHMDFRNFQYTLLFEVDFLKKGFTREMLEKKKPIIEVSMLIALLRKNPSSKCTDVYFKLLKENEILCNGMLKENESDCKVYKKKWSPNTEANKWEKISYKFENYSPGICRLAIAEKSNCQVLSGNIVVVIHK